MSPRPIFEHLNYKNYLNERLKTSGEGRGMRSGLALHLGCQTAFISQVLNADAHFSLAHAILINEFLGHTEAESHYFMLLVHYERAGSKYLENYYRAQIDAIRREHQLVRERIRVRGSLSKEDQTIYYSAWYYAAIHIVLLNPRFRTPSRISAHLHLPLPLVSKTLEFLVSCGLAREEKGEFKTGSARIHLGTDSPMISRHHTNWRVKAMESFDNPSSGDVHYSSVLSMSEKHVEAFRQIVLEALERGESLLENSPDEAMYSLCVDFFRV